MDSVSVTWYGQSGFRLAAGDSRILIDPFLSDRPDRRYPPPASAADFADVTLVLCTHEHADHLDLPFLREFCAVNSAARIVVPAPVVEVAAKAGVDRDRLMGAAPGEDLSAAGVTVHPLPALAALAPDVLMLPINGRDHMRESAGIVGNMNETEAAWLCAQLGAAYVIPMHYDAIKGNTGDPGHFTSMAHRSGTAAAIMIPTRARAITVTLP